MSPKEGHFSARKGQNWKLNDSNKPIHFLLLVFSGDKDLKRGRVCSSYKYGVSRE